MASRKKADAGLTDPGGLFPSLRNCHGESRTQGNPRSKAAVKGPPVRQLMRSSTPPAHGAVLPLYKAEQLRAGFDFLSPPAL